jgi:hypothetical protein
MEEMIETEELAALEEEEEIVAPPEEAIPGEEVAVATPKLPEEMKDHRSRNTTGLLSNSRAT